MTAEMTARLEESTEESAQAVDEALALAGLAAEDVRVAIVVPGRAPGRLTATLARCRGLEAVLVIEPHGEARARFVAAASAAGPAAGAARWVVAGWSGGAGRPQRTSGALEIWQFLLEQGCAPGDALVVPPDATAASAASAAAAAVARDVCAGASAQFFAELYDPALIAAPVLKTIAEHCFATQSFLSALKFFWPLYHAMPDPRIAWRILACFSELGCPDWVDRWLDEPGFEPEFCTQVRGDLADALAQDRAQRADRFARNCAALARLWPAAATLAPPPRAAFALLHPANLAWKLRLDPGAPPRLERDEFPLLMRMSAPALLELTPPPDAAARADVIAALISAGRQHLGVAGWVHHAWAAQFVLSMPDSGHLPGWVHRVFLIEPDLTALAALLETRDFTAALAGDRVRPFLGPGAQAAFLAHLDAHPDVGVPRVWTGLSDDLAARLAAVKETRTRRTLENRQRLDVQHSEARLAETLALLEGSAATARPLRLAFVTSIYTDVLQYAAADLAEGFRTLGHDALVLHEATRGEELHLESVTARLGSFDADAVVMLDHTRAEVLAFFPPLLPVVCWVQDEMPALKDPALITQLGELDLAYAYNTIVQKELQALGHPFVGHLPFAVDPRDFPRDVPLVPASQQRDEVVFATNVVAPDDITDFPALRPLLEERLTAAPEVPLGNEALAGLLDEALARLAVPAERLTARRRGELAYWTFCLARRLDRIRIADDLQDAGIPLVLYGRGWDALPRFRGVARGPVAPGAPVRRVFAAHKVVMHINRGANLHQRVLEGFLAGAFVAARHDPMDDLPGETVDQFALGSELVLFRDKAEMVSLIHRAFSDEPWRAAVVAAAQARIRRSHTFVQRAELILTDLRRQLRRRADRGAGGGAAATLRNAG